MIPGSEKAGNVNPAVGMIRLVLIHNPGVGATGLLELCKMVNPKHCNQTMQPS